MISRSLKLNVSFDTDCILQQIVLFVKNLDIVELKKNKLKFTAVTMFNVVLQKQTASDKNTDAEMIIDVCHDILKSMTKIVKCDDDNDTISFAIDSLCSTCASSARWDIRQFIFLRRQYIKTIFVTNKMFPCPQILPHARFERKESDRT